MSVVILVEHHADRRIKRRRKLMPRHERRRNRVADVILKRLPRPTRDLQQRAMITTRKIYNSGPLSFMEFTRSTSSFAKSSKTVGSCCGRVLSSAARTSVNEFVDRIIICSIGTVRFAIVGMISNPLISMVCRSRLTARPRRRHLRIHDAFAALALPQSEPGLTRSG
jgi:hypothetical protein